jgi:prephenate dehydrogenase
MAGSERTGVEAASSHLYENAYYVLTPAKDTAAEAYERLSKLLLLTRAQLVKMNADEHDDIVGAVSHLPHMIAAALVNQVCGYNMEDEMYSRLAAGGFRDFTRIASGDPVLWRDILLNNRQVLLRLLKDWNAEVGHFADMLERGDGEGIASAFEKASSFRNSLPERRKGVITSIYDVYVDVPDHPGVIGQIATLLGSRQINLSNIQIYESRLDVPGVLRLSFRNQDDQDKAVAVLKELEYTVRL